MVFAAHSEASVVATVCIVPAGASGIADGIAMRAARPAYVEAVIGAALEVWGPTSEAAVETTACLDCVTARTAAAAAGRTG